MTSQSWVMKWATTTEHIVVHFLRGCLVGSIIAPSIAAMFLCYIPCMFTRYTRTSDGGWYVDVPDTDWHFKIEPFGVYVQWFLCRLRLFFMGREDRSPIRDEEAGGGIELRDRSNRWLRGRRQRQRDEEEGEQLPEPTIPQFTGSYMFSAPGPSNSAVVQQQQQESYGNPEQQQRVRDEFRMERENIQRRVAERRQRDEIEQADAAALAQNEQSAATPQQQQLPRAPESVQGQQVTAPALGLSQGYSPVDPMSPTNPNSLTNEDVERERLDNKRQARAWYIKLRALIP